VVQIYALLHRKLAAEQLASIPSDRFDTECVQPVKLLRSAAGVLAYIAADPCAHFLVETTKFAVPELYGETFQILSRCASTLLSPLSSPSSRDVRMAPSVCLAEAQAVIVKKALLAGKTSLTALAQLCAVCTLVAFLASRSCVELNHCP